MKETSFLWQWWGTRTWVKFQLHLHFCAHFRPLSPLTLHLHNTENSKENSPPNFSCCQNPEWHSHANQLQAGQGKCLWNMWKQIYCITVCWQVEYNAFLLSLTYLCRLSDGTPPEYTLLFFSAHKNSTVLETDTELFSLIYLFNSSLSFIDQETAVIQLENLAHVFPQVPNSSPLKLCQRRRRKAISLITGFLY